MNPPPSRSFSTSVAETREATGGEEKIEEATKSQSPSHKTFLPCPLCQQIPHYKVPHHRKRVAWILDFSLSLFEAKRKLPKQEDRASPIFLYLVPYRLSLIANCATYAQKSMERAKVDMELARLTGGPFEHSQESGWQQSAKRFERARPPARVKCTIGPARPAHMAQSPGRPALPSV